MAGSYLRVSTFVAIAIAIGRIVGGLSSRDQRADRKETKRRQKKDAALLHRFKTQDADRARAAAALGAAARSATETKRGKKPSFAGNEITRTEVRFWHLADIHLEADVPKNGPKNRRDVRTLRT